ncbi:MAG: YqgE/AlgH family protein [Proteobacteria bacterium]|nr:YqgE/AlgH family protein [Pseudomonadota bacterium]
MAEGQLKNQFLLAMPNLLGTYFGDTITYLCEHTEDGAMGLMINRRTDMSLFELLSHAGFKADNRLLQTPVYEGGPVASEQGFVLHSARSMDGRMDLFDTSMDLNNGLMLSTAVDLLERLGQDEGPEHYLIALGYSGWGAGQLEEEIKQNAWLTCPGSADVIFNVQDDQKVTRAAQLLGINFSLIAGQAGHA